MDINICFSSDNNYCQHLGVTIASILKNSKHSDNYNFFIMDGGISAKNKNRIEALKKIKNFNIYYIQMDNSDFANCPMTNYVNYITLPTYYRFKIPSLFPNIEKILYMDCDMVVNDDISKIFEIDIDNYYLAAIPEVFNHCHKERLEFKENEYYFNAGLLLINNKKWIEDNIQEKLFNYAQNPIHEIVYQDQDILNEVLKGSVKYLHLKWNLQHDALFCEESYLYHAQERIDAIEKPSIIHFTNPVKPWIIDCPNKFSSLYFEYLAITPWKNYINKINLLKFKKKINKIFKNLLQGLFSIKNGEKHKIIKLLGIKFKIKSYKLYTKNKLIHLENTINYISNNQFNHAFYQNETNRQLIEDVRVHNETTHRMLEKIQASILNLQSEIESIKNEVKWQAHPLYCINNAANTIFRYMTGLQLTKDYQTERIVCFNIEDAPIDHYQRYKFSENLIDPNDIVLDLACGVGYGSAFIAQKAKEVIGGDINEPSINFARKIFLKENLSFEHINGTNLTYENKFNKIISFETIEHLKEDSLFIQNLYRALKEDGTLICSVPNQTIFPYDPQIVPFHIKHYTVVEIKKLLEENGFKILDLFFQYENKEHQVLPMQEKEGYTIVCVAKK